MTKEELEREARINLKRRFGEFFPQLTISYIMGAEPREKQIADLEAQIEKMKCCGNCTKGNCVNIGQKGKACAYWTSNELRR